MAKAILLAEDSPDDIFLFMHVMRKSGLRNPVKIVYDGVETIAYLSGEGKFAERDKYPFPVILMLDLKMPRLDGFQVLEWINSQPQLKDLLVIVLSQSGHTHDISRAYALGAHSFLTKPFSDTDLLDLAKHFDGRWETSPAQAE